VLWRGTDPFGHGTPKLTPLFSLGGVVSNQWSVTSAAKIAGAKDPREKQIHGAKNFIMKGRGNRRSNIEDEQSSVFVRYPARKVALCGLSGAGNLKVHDEGRGLK